MTVELDNLLRQYLKEYIVLENAHDHAAAANKSELEAKARTTVIADKMLALCRGSETPSYFIVEGKLIIVHTLTVTVKDVETVGLIA